MLPTSTQFRDRFVPAEWAIREKRTEDMAAIAVDEQAGRITADVAGERRAAAEVAERDALAKLTNPRVYYLGPLSVRQRIRADNSLVIERCGEPVTDTQVRTMVRRAIQFTRTGDEMATALALVDELDAIDAELESVPANDRDGRAAIVKRAKPTNDEFELLRGELSAEHKGLAKLLGRERDRLHVQYIQNRAQFGIRAWENVYRRDADGTVVAAECAIGSDGLTDAALDCIPENDLAPIARRIRELSEVTEGEQKN